MNKKVEQALEKIEDLDLYDLHSEDFKTIKNALNQAEDINDLKHIRTTKVKEPLCVVFQRLGFDKNTRYAYIEHIYYSYQEMKETLEKQLEDIKKQAEENENELNELREFVKVLCKMKIVDSNHKIYGINETDIELIKKVVEKYDKKED